MFFPLSSDPLEKVPADRRKLWPLNRRDWLAVRIASLFLSPVVWIALFILLRVGWRLAAQLGYCGPRGAWDFKCFRALGAAV